MGIEARSFFLPLPAVVRSLLAQMASSSRSASATMAPCLPRPAATRLFASGMPTRVSVALRLLPVVQGGHGAYPLSHASLGTLIRKLQAHSKWVYCIAWSPNDDNIVSGSEDYTGAGGVGGWGVVVVYSVARGKGVRGLAPSRFLFRWPEARAKGSRGTARPLLRFGPLCIVGPFALTTVRVHDLLSMPPDEDEEEGGERRKPHVPGFQLDSPVFCLSWTSDETVRGEGVDGRTARPGPPCCAAFSDASYFRHFLHSAADVSCELRVWTSGAACAADTKGCVGGGRVSAPQESFGPDLTVFVFSPCSLGQRASLAWARSFRRTLRETTKVGRLVSPVPPNRSFSFLARPLSFLSATSPFFFCRLACLLAAASPFAHASFSLRPPCPRPHHRSLWPSRAC